MLSGRHSERTSRYRKERRHLPARVVLYETSSFTSEDINGVRTAADGIEPVGSAGGDQVPVRDLAPGINRRIVAGRRQ